MPPSVTRRPIAPPVQVNLEQDAPEQATGPSQSARVPHQVKSAGALGELTLKRRRENTSSEDKSRAGSTKAPRYARTTELLRRQGSFSPPGGAEVVGGASPMSINYETKTYLSSEGVKSIVVVERVYGDKLRFNVKDPLTGETLRTLKNTRVDEPDEYVLMDPENASIAGGNPGNYGIDLATYLAMRNQKGMVTDASLNDQLSRNNINMENVRTRLAFGRGNIRADRDATNCQSVIRTAVGVEVRNHFYHELRDAAYGYIKDLTPEFLPSPSDGIAEALDEFYETAAISAVADYFQAGTCEGFNRLQLARYSYYMADSEIVELIDDRNYGPNGHIWIRSRIGTQSVIQDSWANGSAHAEADSNSRNQSTARVILRLNKQQAQALTETYNTVSSFLKHDEKATRYIEKIVKKFNKAPTQAKRAESSMENDYEGLSATFLNG